MLRLEKVSRNREIHISLRAKEHRFNRSFIIALCLAISLHLSAAFIFHIGPFKIFDGGLILPPAMVTAEIENDFDRDVENQAVAQIDNEGIPQRYLLMPKLSTLTLPKIAEPSVFKEIEFIKEKDPTFNPFLKIERDLQQIYFVKDEPPKEYIPIQIFVSGSLDQNNFLRDDLEMKEFFSLFFPKKNSSSYLKYYRVLYAVQVESKTGQVFWFEAKEKSDVEEMNHIAEKMIKNMRFKKEEKSFVSLGEIEIHFTVPELS